MDLDLREEVMIIDSHMHLYQSKKQGSEAKKNYQIWEYGSKKDVEYSKYSGDVEDALKAIDEAGACKAIIVNLCHEQVLETMNFEGIGDDLADKLKASNEWMCQIAEENPRLEAFIGIDPSILGINEMPSHVEHMVKEYGAKGVKVHPVHQQFFMHDIRMRNVWEICEDLGVPVIAHSGPAKKDPQYASPESFIPTLEAYPDLKVVICHMGGGNWKELPIISHRYTNAFFDISEIIEWMGATRAPSRYELAKLIIEMNPDKVIMGSDFPWYDIKTTVDKVLDLPLLNDGHKASILGRNAKQILRV